MTESERLIDDYLTRLLRELRLGPAMTRRVLAETEDHLREAVERERAAGHADEAAARRAVARFGSPRLVARRFAVEQGIPLLPPSVMLHLVLALGLLTGVGMAAIGVSGMLAAGMGGTGTMLSGGIVALVVFALFARSLLGTLSVYGIDG